MNKLVKIVSKLLTTENIFTDEHLAVFAEVMRDVSTSPKDTQDPPSPVTSLAPRVIEIAKGASSSAPFVEKIDETLEITADDVQGASSSSPSNENIDDTLVFPPQSEKQWGPIILASPLELKKRFRDEISYREKLLVFLEQIQGHTIEFLKLKKKLDESQ